MNLLSSITLNNQVKMPQFGFGVFRSAEGQETYQSVLWALEAGYRHIDTAMVYGNEVSVGKAIRDSGISRAEIFLTTKLWNDDMRRDRQEQAFQESLERLSVEYIDLYLVHWPVAGKFHESWKKMETIYKTGKVRAIGVSNFQQHHLETILTDAKIIPAVNQIELHPQLSQVPLVEFCTSKGIVIEAWSPLGGGELVSNPQLQKIGAKYNKSAVQVILRWDLQRGIITIPKSVHKERIISNAQVFDFELSPEDMAKINCLNQDKRTGADPDTFNF